MLLSSAVASAAAQATTARLEVDAAPGCSTRDELIARVVARSTRIRFVNDGTGRARPDRAHRGRTAGRRRRRADRRGAGRPQVRAPARGAVVRGGDGRGRPGRGHHARSRAPRRARCRGGRTTGADARRGGAGHAGGRRHITDADAPEPAPEPAPRDAANGTGDAGEPPVAGHPPPDRRGRGRGGRGSRADADAGHRHRGPGGARSRLDPVARAGADAGARLERRRRWRPAAPRRSRWICSLWMPVRCASRCAALEARACAAGSLGRLAAEGSHTYEPRSVASPFATAGGTVRLAVLFGSRVELRARFGAGATLVARCVPVQSRGVSPGRFGYPGRGRGDRRAVSVIG